jgi:hypothetical protein
MTCEQHECSVVMIEKERGKGRGRGKEKGKGKVGGKQS